jgi:hypothetical protein
MARMHGPLILATAALLALTACRTAPPVTGKAPPARVLAQGDGLTVTEDEFRARWSEACHPPSSPPKPACLPAKRGELLDNIVKFELLLVEARRLGLDKDPEVLSLLDRIMVQKLVQRRFAGAQAQPAGSTPEDVKAARKRAGDEFDLWVRGLREQSHVRIDPAALEAVPLEP